MWNFISPILGQDTNTHTHTHKYNPINLIAMHTLVFDLLEMPISNGHSCADE